MKNAADFDVRMKLANNGIDSEISRGDILFKIEVPPRYDFNKTGYIYYIYDEEFKILHKDGILIAEFKTHEQFYKLLNLK